MDGLEKIKVFLKGVASQCPEIFGSVESILIRVKIFVFFLWGLYLIFRL